MSNTVTIAGKNFKFYKIDAKKQFHIIRRMLPLLKSLPAAMGDLPSIIDENGNRKVDFKKVDLQKLFLIFNEISALSDDDADRVLFGLLEGAELQQEGGNWARVVNNAGLMFQDLELPVLLQVAGHSFKFNFANFLANAPQKES